MCLCVCDPMQDLRRKDIRAKTFEVGMNEGVASKGKVDCGLG